MAEYIKFQPVIFGEQLDECLLNTSGYSMPVLLGDNTQFQFKIDGCSSASDILDYADFVLGTNWSVAGSIYTHTAGASGNLYNSVPMTSSGYYKIIVTAGAVTSGSVTIKAGLTVKGVITANGTYEFFQTGPILGTGLTFAASSDFQGQVGFVSVLIMTKAMKVIIYNAESNAQVAILDNTDGYFDFTNQYWTTTIDWGTLGIPYGCYYIGIADECLNTCNQLFMPGQDFYQESFWTKLVNNNATTQLTLANNSWAYDSTSVVGTGSLTNNYPVCSGKTYVVTYTVKFGSGDPSVTIKFGTAAGTARTIDGTYTDTIVSNGTSFSINFASSVNPSNVGVSYLTVTVIDSDLTSDYYSNHFLYTDSFNCSKMISAVCDENSFNMGFVNTGFIPRVRLESKIILSGYPQNRIMTRTSQGEKRIDYFESDKNWRLKILRQPEHIMDFLAVMVGFDHWYIDSVEYFASEDEFAEPKPNKFFNVYDIDIECQKKTLLLVNKNCDDNVENGELSAEQIVSEDSRDVVSASGISVVSYSKG